MDALDTGDSLFNRVADDLDVAMRDSWVPDEAFLTRRRKDQLEAIAKESGAIARLGRMKDYSKTQLAAALARHFQRCAEGDTTIPEEMRNRANAWLPDAMRFPAVTAEADAPEPESEEGEIEDIETDAIDPSTFEDADGLTEVAA
jgi:ParB family chromosome partitioning protein